MKDGDKIENHFANKTSQIDWKKNCRRTHTRKQQSVLYNETNGGRATQMSFYASVQRVSSIRISVVDLTLFF